MMPLYTKLNLEQYRSKVEQQKEVLQLSTIISKNCKQELTDCYELQIKIATTELEFLKVKNMGVSFELVSAPGNVF